MKKGRQEKQLFFFNLEAKMKELVVKFEDKIENSQGLLTLGRLDFTFHRNTDYNFM